MRKMTLFILVCFAALLLCMEAHANYRIELKSGRSIITSYYWEENGRIMFYQLGGVVGYPADQVERITDTDRPEPVETPREEPDVDEEPLHEADVAEQGDVEVPAELDMDPEEFQAKVEQYQRSLITLWAERRQYHLDLEVAERNNDESAIEELKKKITDLQYKRMSLRREVIDFYGNKYPDWWDEHMELY
jgi:hypothetical protein